MTRLFKLFIIPSIIITQALIADSDEIDSGALRYKSMIATRTEVPPTIDGNIDDEAWDQAVVLDDFVQFVIWDLGIIRIVENLHARSTNISWYRGDHYDILVFFLFLIFKKQL